MPRAPKSARPSPVSPTTASANAAAPASDVLGRIVELRVSANLMTLDRGLYCLFQEPGQIAAPRDGSGLPGVRITLPPAPMSGAVPTEPVRIRGLHPDGWLGPRDGAILVSVPSDPAQILVTVYQSPNHPAEAAPRLKVVRLESEQAAPGPRAASPAAIVVAPEAPAPGVATADVVAHVQRTGDLPVRFGQWVGIRGSKQWIEGFGLTALPGIDPDEIEYQAVLGRGWLSPWISAGKFCGSRGMALPLLGFNVRLRGKAQERFDCDYSACFTDGTEVGPIAAGNTCEAASLAPLEAFQLDLRPRATPAARKKPAKARPATKPPARRTPKRKAPAPRRR